MRLILSFAAVMAGFMLWQSGTLPNWLAMLAAVSSAASLLLYGIDKAAAQAGGARVPERWLQGISLAGGWPGALLAQALFRHKTRKQPFLWVFGLCVVMNIGLISSLLYLTTPP
ncbi:DUF1294 domain-containing protein [Chitinimonas sp. BJYL2]|uniref:DUF1294 domain-containing protein n=1 Tax=Chitinimonas sp. BJYL2 TaxID=2976696 RepID=UPI0022B4375C|nr:DUF1294 domain-containing protein [Chitinimonas sp. BJYL2]